MLVTYNTSWPLLDAFERTVNLTRAIALIAGPIRLHQVYEIIFTVVEPTSGDGLNQWRSWSITDAHKPDTRRLCELHAELLSKLRPKRVRQTEQTRERGLSIDVIPRDKPLPVRNYTGCRHALICAAGKCNTDRLVSDLRQRLDSLERVVF